jgi:hypothetical protein
MSANAWKGRVQLQRSLEVLKWKFLRKRFARPTNVPNKTRVDTFPRRLSEWDLGPISNHAVISDISMRDEFS